MKPQPGVFKHSAGGPPPPPPPLSVPSAFTSGPARMAQGPSGPTCPLSPHFSRPLTESGHVGSPRLPGGRLFPRRGASPCLCVCPPRFASLLRGRACPSPMFCSKTATLHPLYLTPQVSHHPRLTWAFLFHCSPFLKQHILVCIVSSVGWNRSSFFFPPRKAQKMHTSPFLQTREFPHTRQTTCMGRGLDWTLAPIGCCPPSPGMALQHKEASGVGTEPSSPPSPTHVTWLAHLALPQSLRPARGSAASFRWPLLRFWPLSLVSF